MKTLNSTWEAAHQVIEALGREIYTGIEAAIDIFGEHVGRKFSGDKYQRALNRALFEVQAYYLSFPNVRQAALRRRKAVRDLAKDLFADADFSASIEATTKSIETISCDLESISACFTKRAVPR